MSDVGRGVEFLLLRRILVLLLLRVDISSIILYICGSITTDDYTVVVSIILGYTIRQYINRMSR